MKRQWMLYALAASLMLTAGCGGWHLRGSEASGRGLDHRILLRAGGAYNVGVALRTEIVNRGGGIANTAANADIIVDIERERFERRILSVDPDTGKVREIELGLAIMYSARTPDGRLLIPREEATWANDYVFDEGSVLGTTEQDVVVQRDLAALAATSIALRLQAVDLPPPAVAARGS